MPIKFRCEHCRQLLGISRAKAGQVADCPTCGRSVRVPALDGKKEPLPPPELDLADSRLAGALDELAQIGLDDHEETLVAEAPEPMSQKAVVIPAEPLPAPVPIEPPAASVPDQSKEAEKPAAPSSLDPKQTEAALSELARGAPAKEAIAPLPGRSKWRQLAAQLTPPVIGMLIGAIVIGFGIGLLVGRGSSSETPPVANGNGSEEKSPPKTIDATTAVKGRITYKNEDGDSRPDQKARVLVFPQERVGQRKLDITGLRAGDSPDDFRSAAAAFRALGGDVTLVNDDGSFELSLPAAGTYQILVLSNYQPRDEDAVTAAPLTNLLTQYFDRPEQLLGRVAHHFAQIRYKGAEPVPWDHSF